MVILRRLGAIVRSTLGRPHSDDPARAALYLHVHQWDICRQYGQYRYRICLLGCGAKQAC